VDREQQQARIEAFQLMHRRDREQMNYLEARIEELESALREIAEKASWTQAPYPRANIESLARQALSQPKEAACG
jgi:BMFP domain-containing protein YqiC